MKSLEKHIQELNKQCDRKRQSHETMAQRAVRLHDEELYSPLSMFVRATKDIKRRQKLLDAGYQEFLGLHDEGKVGTYSHKNENGASTWIIQTELGPIIKVETDDKKGVYFAGYSVSKDYRTDTEHYYYTRIGYVSDGKNKMTGFIRDDNGIFHEWNSVRGKQLNLRPFQTLEERFCEAISMSKVDGDAECEFELQDFYF